MNRRHFIVSLSFLSVGWKADKLKIIIAGGHPDDPETGAGGVAALWAEQGHDVILAYFTTGEAGIANTKADAAASIRKNEAEEACKILGTKSVYLGQIDGSSFVTNEWYDKITQFLNNQKADVLLTHWPVDSHRDHRHCAAVFFDAWLNNGKKEALYFYEVMSGDQTQNFQPTDYVNISSVIQKKHQACFVHKSQKIEENYPNDHARMEIFRGMEAGFEYAEAFVKHSKSKSSSLFR